MRNHIHADIRDCQGEKLHVVGKN